MFYQLAHSSSRSRSPAAPTAFTETHVAQAIVEAAIPAGKTFGQGDANTVRRAQHIMRDLPPKLLARYRTLLRVLDVSTLPSYGSRFHKLPLQQRQRHLEKLADSDSTWLRGLLHTLMFPLAYAHFDTDDYYGKVQLPRLACPPTKPETPRWHQQMMRGSEVDENMDIECEVVVVGTGAGGAACAYELASRGRAVLLVEQGEFFDRSNMRGSPFDSFKKMYLNNGLTVAAGSGYIPVWAGNTVGGSTTINSGTCYRAPDDILSRWVEHYGLDELSADSLAPLYERVETMLDVQIAPEAYLGGVARVVARGADRLGYRHGPVPRNAPGCDGAGVCAFGCPTGAKRSTDVSYVPAALERGAQLIYEARVHTITKKDGHATGIEATLASGKRLRVSADAVVISAGAMLTPNILRSNGIAVDNKWLGRNLSIHPAAKLFGVFDENIDMVRSAIPQGYAVDEFKKEGLMLEGASLPPSAAAFAIDAIGPRFTEIMDAYRQVALFGFMIRDHSRGRVLPGPIGSTRMLYYMSRRDLAKVHRGMSEVAKIMLAAGAHKVITFVHGFPEIRSWSDLREFQQISLKHSDVELTAYHPLGTCRVGSDPSRSVLSPGHEAWDLRRLFVVDGSAIPSSLGVNPQMTIMAMALRAAGIIDASLPD